YPAPVRMLEAVHEALARAEVLCLNVGLTLLNRAAARAAQRVAVPYVYNAEGALCPVRLRIKRLRKRAFVHLVERPLLAGADAVQALTAAEARYLEQQHGVPRSRIRVVPNGVAPPPAVDRTARDALRRALRLADDDRVVLFLGRLTAIKGIDLLIDAVARVRTALPALRLVVAGPDDGERAALERRARRLGLE